MQASVDVSEVMPVYRLGGRSSRPVDRPIALNNALAREKGSLIHSRRLLKYSNMGPRIPHGVIPPAGPFHSPIGIDGNSTNVSGWHMSWRFAAAKLASPEKESSSLIEFQSTAITRGPDPLRTQPASSYNVPSRRPLRLLGILSCPILRGGACLRASFRHGQPFNVPS